MTPNQQKSNMFRKNKIVNYLLGITIILFLYGCSSYTPPSDISHTKPQPLKVYKFTLPGSSYGDWRYLGITKYNQTSDEINHNSIELIDNNLYKYQDRKTVVLVSNFTYHTNQPKYKFAISNWEMNCITKQYRITNTILYDTYGNQITKYNFNSSIWIKINPHSVSDMQYNYICVHVNNLLGY